MAATWFLVADANRARIFSSPTPLAPWYEEADFVNTDRGAHPYADRPGRSHDRMGAARHAMEPEVSVERRELEQFTRRLADYLEDARSKGCFGNLVLVASPNVLGLLRGTLDRPTMKLVSKSVGKDVVRLAPGEIRHLLD